ncbi:MAG TPA: hypothetical protein VJA86_00330 [Candidatus Nanoarchaeia archaeon]|nr:hypothetical protein [Candidatus Nanoarchaeia archaeon]
MAKWRFWYIENSEWKKSKKLIEAKNQEEADEKGDNWFRKQKRFWINNIAVRSFAMMKETLRVRG